MKIQTLIEAPIPSSFDATLKRRGLSPSSSSSTSSNVPSSYEAAVKRQEEKKAARLAKNATPRPKEDVRQSPAPEDQKIAPQDFIVKYFRDNPEKQKIVLNLLAQRIKSGK